MQPQKIKAGTQMTHPLGTPTTPEPSAILGLLAVSSIGALVNFILLNRI